MSRLGFRERLFILSLGMVSLFALGSALILETGLRASMIEEMELDLTRIARATQEAVSRAQGESVDATADALGAATSTRITLIDAAGAVVGDSEVAQDQLSTLENHGDRPEVVAAAAEGVGSARRMSTTVGEEMLYVAVRGSKGVARAAVPLDELDRSVWQLRLVILLASLFGLAIAAIVSAVASSWMASPLQQLVVRARVHGPEEEQESGEIPVIAGSLDRLAHELDDAMSDLASERDRFRSILQAMGDPVLVFDLDGTILLKNAAAQRQLGLHTAIARLDEIPLPGLADVVASLEEDETASAELTTPRGTVFLLTATTLLDVARVVIVARDITSLRHLEAVRRDFVANVSHELRTPLAVIRSSAETLVEGAAEDPVHRARFLDAIVRNSERLSSLITDVLDLARIEAGEVGLKTQILDAEEIAEQVADSLFSTLAKRHQTLDVQVPEGTLLLADPTMIEHVLGNLLDNAVKYSPPRGRIQIEVIPDGGAVTIEVHDEGPGVPPEHRDRLFERFYRVDPGRSRRIGGTGLGLSIAKHLANLMGGEVGMKPRDPVGSTFWVRLPAPPADTGS